MSNRLVLKGCRIVDVSQNIDSTGDIVIDNGKVSDLVLNKAGSKSSYPGAEIIDVSGLLAMPGFVDMHTHLREPGFEHKETIETGTLAAIKGGFTSVCPMPNTNPVNDNPTVTTFIIKRAMKRGSCSVYPIGSITKGQNGEELAEMGMMLEAGCVAFSDDGKPVMNALVMKRALEYSKVFGVPLISHCEDMSLTANGVMNEGSLATLLGLEGIPRSSEELIVSRDIMLAGYAEARLHIAHVSTRGSVELIRLAKARGVQVTAETCPHYFTITEDAVSGYNTDAKVNPPLRCAEDISAIKEGLKDGTIDVIATDHAPHHADEKLLEFDRAPSGISGLETALSLSLKLVEEGILSYPDLCRKISYAPSEILGLGRGTLKKGACADIAIIDTQKKFVVSKDRFLSKGKNTPFENMELKGMPVAVVVKGKYINILEL
ncbi:MAG: dihydroorotase [Dissulfurispiraceae bacterium]|jgi:dihydroorotase|nr:dihydroorotase [Dissulfurispiraceae bacterium]